MSPSTVYVDKITFPQLLQYGTMFGFTFTMTMVTTKVQLIIAIHSDGRLNIATAISYPEMCIYVIDSYQMEL